VRIGQVFHAKAGLKWFKISVPLARGHHFSKFTHKERKKKRVSEPPEPPPVAMYLLTNHSGNRQLMNKTPFEFGPAEIRARGFPLRPFTEPGTLVLLAAIFTARLYAVALVHSPCLASSALAVQIIFTWHTGGLNLRSAL
jgi:hypothetical protein